MKSLLIKYIFFIFVLTLECCTSDSYLDIPEPDDKIVIDGWIESGQYAKVLLTKNSPYFSSVDSASLRDLVLTRAKVTLTDGINEEILTLKRNDDYFPPFIYEGSEIKGDTGKLYTLKAEFGGKTAWGSTTIPRKVPLDTLCFRLTSDSDSLGSIYLEFTDPLETKDYYRILTKRINQDTRYYSPMIMGFDDIFFSGQKFGFTMSNGPRSIMSTNTYDYFKIGDTISIKFCTIDKAHYEFWNSFQTEVFNSGNPFASSLSKIKSNIQGDGLGIWGGYGVSIYTLIVK